MDNSGVKAESLYTTPQQVNGDLLPEHLSILTFLHLRSSPFTPPPLQVYKVHQALSPISPMFSIAAAFGNVHGVYKVKLPLPTT